MRRLLGLLAALGITLVLPTRLAEAQTDPGLSPWVRRSFGIMSGPLRFRGYANGSEPVSCSAAEAGDVVYSTTDNSLRFCNGTTWGSVGGGGGVITGSGVADRLMIWSGTSTATSDADLTWTSGNNTLNVTGTVAITGALSSSGGAVTFGSLTASRALFLDGSSIVSTTGASAALAASLADETGSGAAVFATSPTLVTPILGAASATSIEFANGSAAAPSITFTSDTDTGLYRSAANTLGVATNGGGGFLFSGGTTPRLSFVGGTTYALEADNGVDLFRFYKGATVVWMVPAAVSGYQVFSTNVNTRIGVGTNTPGRSITVLDSASSTPVEIGIYNTGLNDASVGFGLAQDTNTWTIGLDNSDNDRFKLSTSVLGTGDRIAVDGRTSGLTASTEAIGLEFDLSQTRTWASGSIATQREAVFRAPTYAFSGASTITTAATVAITGAPTAGTNATITTPLALWVQSGTTNIDDLTTRGNVTIGDSTADTLSAFTGAIAMGADVLGTNLTFINLVTGSSIDTYTSIVQLYRARGTTASPTVIAADDYMGRVVFGGYSGAAAAYQNAVFIDARSDGTPDSGGDTTDMPSRLEFSTTPDGTATPLVRMTIKNDGHILLGGGTAASELRFLEPSGSGTNYTAFVAQAQSANITYTLPSAQGAANSILTNDGSGGLSWVTGSGTSTPSCTNDANVTASCGQAQHSRVGSTVTMSLRIMVDPTAAATSTEVGIPIPVASNFTAETNCAGACFASGIAAQGAAVRADTTNDRCQLVFISADITDQPMYCTFTYVVQ
jgi:hypothetical protein